MYGVCKIFGDVSITRNNNLSKYSSSSVFCFVSSRKLLCSWTIISIRSCKHFCYKYMLLIINYSILKFFSSAIKSVLHTSLVLPSNFWRTSDESFECEFWLWLESFSLPIIIRSYALFQEDNADLFSIEIQRQKY